MKQFFRLVFNYYLVLKSCWFVVLFLFLGFFSLVVFDQGQDILKALSFTGDSEIVRQTWFVYLSVAWWSWQTFRSSRLILHFSYFNFWTYLPSYSLRAQVLIPRVLATLPFFILALALYRSLQAFTPFVMLLISTGIWMFVLLHFRRMLIVKLRSWKPFIPALVPDYIPIKNGTYPVSFIWAKQQRWFLFRLAVLICLFTTVYLFPVDFPQYLGSATVVLLGFGSWLIMASIISFIEKYLRFPVTFSILLMVVTFSFFNNNHNINTIENSTVNRPDLSEHFTQWIENQNQHTSDSINVYLVMAEGGGLRSAYWTTSILNTINQSDTTFANKIYAYSSVSGGSLGTMMFHSTNKNPELNPENLAAPNLDSDLLSPITSALIFTDLLQKFIPIPVKSLDRSRVLEKSFENSLPQPEEWQKGFVNYLNTKTDPLVMINTTHVESGHRTIISNANLVELKENNVQDFFSIVQKDVSISTSIGIGSRFPFITPPALVLDSNNRNWGNLVDGGYYENLGMQTMLDVYSVIRQVAQEQGFKVRFKFIAIRNNKLPQVDKPVLGMVESLAPAVTFSHIWGNNSNEALTNGQKLIHSNGDELYVLSLQRDDNENIPLGWYLSESARNNLNKQLFEISDSTIRAILKK